MLTNKVKIKILLLFFLIFCLSSVVFYILKSLNDNVVFFFSPTEIYTNYNKTNEKFRVGGLVKINSIIRKDNSINFIITDLKNEIFVSYTGVVPNLFAEGKGVVAEGTLNDKKFFIANKILAKHDENYMPPEVISALNNGKY